MRAVPITVVSLALSGFATSASPCSVPSIPTAAELVRDAEIIVRARAERVAADSGRPGPLAGSPTQIEFRVLSVLKGRLVESQLTFNGRFVAGDERNRGKVPYSFARSSADASCFALEYRPGGEYLLFLRRAADVAYAQPEQLTPYWAPLAPTNEQVFGSSDSWELWTRDQLRPRKR
jgi:hypothetical protein